ncbi:hypothetical protein [Paenibacillus yonginensis]|uniref:hypothetical protein n=1 Tax=Paenibacillus yonginensis TaxID=1462996 RepID=UPI00147117EB|nr:hypothetical protein [Paenibacillus yonginensis]
MNIGTLYEIPSSANKKPNERIIDDVAVIGPINEEDATGNDQFKKIKDSSL